MLTSVSEATPTQITASRLIAVEGKDEVNLLTALRRFMKIDNVEVRDLCGKYSLSDKLTSLTKTPGFSQVVCLGVIRDADDDAQATFQSVCAALKNAGQAVPSVPLQVIKGDRDMPQVAVLIVPYESNQGMLEDLCLRSVADDPAMKCVDTYFECLNNSLNALPPNMSKAKVHAFLSSRSQPDLRLGEAAQAGYWPWTSQAFTEIKKFLLLVAGL